MVLAWCFPQMSPLPLFILLLGSKTSRNSGDGCPPHQPYPLNGGGVNIKLTAVTRNGLCSRKTLKDSCPRFPGGRRYHSKWAKLVAAGQSSSERCQCREPGETLARLQLGQIGVSACSEVRAIRSAGTCVTQSVPAAHCLQSSAFPAFGELYI